MSKSRRSQVWFRALAVMIGIGGVGAVASVTAHARSASSSAADTAPRASSVTIEIPEVSCAGCNPKARTALKAAGGVLRLTEAILKIV